LHIFRINKKGAQSLFAALIGLAMVAVIIVVLILIFTGKIGLLNKSTECTAQGGVCTTYCEYAVLHGDGCKANEVCCLKPD